ncbi:MAG: RHS repeat domain-containing protein [Microthrixaceae bacterium]
MLRRSPRRTIRTLAIACTCISLIAVACSQPDDDSADGSGRTQGEPASLATDTLEPEQAPPLPQLGDGAGPTTPTWPSVVVDQSLGSATTTTPMLRWTGASGPAPYRFVVRDLGPDGGRELWSSGDEPRPAAQVPDGVMTNARAYRWTASDGSGNVLGPLVVRVDVQRDGIQAVGGFGDVAVAGATGEAVVDWSSPTLETVSGPVGFRLQHRPSNGSATPGLPGGWRLTTSGAGGWRQLIDNADGTITAEAETGLIVIFEPTDDPTSFRAVWGERQTWPSGTFSSLVRNADGNTFTMQDTSGTVTTFATPAGWTTAPVSSVWQAGAPTPIRRYDGGRLTALEDPVSGRSIEFRYAGEDCPSAGEAFDPTPDGMLCSARLWDGSEVVLGYVGSGASARLTRLVAFHDAKSGTEVTDLAFDGVGRVVAVRSPLAARAIAAGVRAADESTTTQLAYDADGRVRRVTGPAPTPGAPRAERALIFELDGDRLTTTVSAPQAPGSPTLSSATADAATFQVVEWRDATGRQRTITWDRGADRVVEQTEPGGLITRFLTDESGGATGRLGPASRAAIDSGAAPSQSVQTDQTFRDAADLSGTPMRGLAVTYWGDGNRTGDPVRAEVGPLFGEAVPDDFRFAWTNSPVPGSDWSARLAGVIRLPAAGDWNITTGGAPLWVDERPCRPTCAVSASAPRAARIRIDVTGPNGDVELSWSGPGVSGIVPSNSLAPALGRQGAVRVSDATAVGAPNEAVSRTEWADPVAGVISASLAQSGIRRTTVAEPYRPTSGEYGRVTTQAAPSGSARTLRYHAAREGVADPCSPDQRHVQGGLMRSNVDPSGENVPDVVSEVVYDDAGRQIATRATAAEPWTCTRRDRAGRAVLTENTGATGEQERTVEVDYTGTSAASPQDPLVTTAISTPASGPPSTESGTVDLLGRLVRTVDLWGTVVTQTFDPQFPDRLVASTVAPAGIAPRTTTYDYDLDGNRLGARSGDLVLSSYRYDDNGWVRSVTNGPNVSSYDYDANGRPVSRTIDGPSGRSSEVQVLSPAGRTLAAVLDGPGDADGRYDYRYDVDGRLIDARLDTSVAVTERGWTYTYDNDGNLTTRGIVDGSGATRSITNRYDAASHLLTTDDPVFADPTTPSRSGAVVTDDHGRITAIGPLTITYDADGNATRIQHTDGSSVSWTFRFGRAVVRTTTDLAGATESIRISAGGVLLDGDGRFVGQSIGGSGGAELLLRADGTQRWTFATIGGNRWFSTDGGGALDGAAALFEPFGRQISPEASSATAAVDPIRHGFQMADQQRLGAIDITSMGARTYLPALGRFLQPDPVPGGSGNPYAYTDGDPVNSHDASGNMPEWLNKTLAAIAVVGSFGLAAVAGPRAGTYVAARFALNSGAAANTALRYIAASVAGGAISGLGSAAGGLLAQGEVNLIPTLLGAAAGITASAGRTWWKAVQMEEAGAAQLQNHVARRAAYNEQATRARIDRARSITSFKVSEVRRVGTNDLAIIGEPISLNQQVNSFTVIPNQLARGRTPSFGDAGTVLQGF